MHTPNTPGWISANRLGFSLLQLALLLISFPVTGTLCAGQELTRGQILETVACQGNPLQTYALYLPSSYVPDRKWPILYALDPGARGLMPVRRFREAAEKYGYILAGSNNSRNGPVRIVEEAVNAMLRDTQLRFSIDTQRFYLAGFSGGARAAVEVGFAMKGKVAGIAAFGAGFPSDLPPTAATPFAVYLAAGFEDFNFPELRELDRTLSGLRVPHQFETFPGGHDWPPEVVCTHAVEWLELEAMKSGLRGRDASLIESIYAQTVEEAEALERQGRRDASLERYAAAREVFSGLRDLTAVTLKIRQLDPAEDVRKSRALEKDVERRQKITVSDLSLLFENVKAGRDPLAAAQELRTRLSRIRGEADQKKDAVARIAGLRVLTEFWIVLNAEASDAFEKQDFRAAALRLELMTQIQPDNPQVFFHLARAQSLGGRTKQAMEALVNAVAKGYRDIETLESSPDLEPLKKKREYREILDDLRKRRRHP